jgi:hypothetical protein
LSLPSSVFTVSGSPVTSGGSLSATFVSQSANTFFAGPTSGTAATPTFRALVAGDLPTGSINYIQNQISSAQTSANYWIDGIGMMVRAVVVKGWTNANVTTFDTYNLGVTATLNGTISTAAYHFATTSTVNLLSASVGGYSTAGVHGHLNLNNATYTQSDIPNYMAAGILGEVTLQGTSTANHVIGVGTYLRRYDRATATNYYGVYIHTLASGITNEWGLYQSSSTAKNFFAGGVAIGTSLISGTKLTVGGNMTLTSAGDTKIAVLSGNYYPSINFTNLLGSQGGIMGYTGMWYDSTSGHVWRVNNSGSAAMQLDGSGQLLINVGSQGSYKLQVGGHIWSNGCIGFAMGSTFGAPSVWSNDGGELSLAAPGSNPIRFRSARLSTNSQVTYWDIGGNAPLTFQATGNGSSPDIIRIYNWDAASEDTIAGLGFVANRTTGGGTIIARIVGQITDVGNTSYKVVLSFYTAENASPIERMRINHAGEVLINTTDQGDYKLQVAGGLYLDVSDKTAKLNLGSDATGDLYYRNSSGNLTRLPIGPENSFLTILGGIPSWTMG